MNPKRPSSASRSARIGSVALGYLGVCWMVLQIVDVLSGMFALPAWVARWVLVLLLVGLVMVAATAWVQADPETTEREQAGEVPTDWQVAPAEALSALARGRLPHLTWGRTLLAGVVALSLLFGVAGAYVLVTRGGLDPGANGPGADAAESTARIAVLPFTTRGEGLGVYEEGMVELLSTNLDGLGQVQAIDARTVLARWDERVGSSDRVDLEASLGVATATGASHALLGSLVSAGPNVRLVGQLLVLATGDQMTEVREEGPADEILLLVDRLSVAVAREILGSEDAVSETGIRLASITTASIPALELYLEAEAHYRRGQFASAVPLLERAIEADSTFGLAVLRRAQAFGWMPTNPDSLAAARRAIRPLLERLSPRDRVLAEGGIIDFADRDPNGVAMLREFVSRNPDEAEGWFQLSDFLYHLNDLRGGTADEILGGFDRAVELGPRFVPYYIHAVEGALTRGDSARFVQLVDRYVALGGEPQRAEGWRLAASALFGNGTQATEGLVDSTTELAGLARFLSTSNRPQRVADFFEQLPASGVTADLFLRAGRWQSIARAYPDGVRPEGQRPPFRPTLLATAEAWIGAFDMDPGSLRLIAPSAPSLDSGEWWIPDAETPATVRAMLAARDDGTGADPMLLAHLAERAGDLDLAARLFEEESWRYLGPAATYRLARIRDRQGRGYEALRLYRSFLESWSGADRDLPPVVEANAAVDRLAAEVDEGGR